MIPLSSKEAAKLGLGKKRSKYGVRHDSLGKLGRTVDGIKFASQKEANRYCELKVLKSAGEIGPISRQVPYEFEFEGKIMFRYVADFVYPDKRRRLIVVEDVKGYRTPEYKLKKKLIEAQWKFEIEEI
jgi:uncharacterized protein DUF1064